jgi:hypothetical protein
VARAVLGPARPARPADVEDARVPVVVQQGHVRLAGHVAIPAERYVHHRELQPLAAVHGDDLHRGGVRVEPPAALEPDVRRGLVDAVA